MGGLMSRNKGKRGEQEICRLLQPVVNEVYEIFELDPPKLKRNTLQSDDGGCDIAGVPWAAIEIKYHAQLNLSAWWQQTVEQAERGQEPVLLYRRNNARWRARMYGMLGRPGIGLTVPVDVDIESFLVWFRLRLTEELQNGQ